jgi:hypothetical protein
VFSSIDRRLSTLQLEDLVDSVYVEVVSMAVTMLMSWELHSTLGMTGLDANVKEHLRADIAEGAFRMELDRLSIEISQFFSADYKYQLLFKTYLWLKAYGSTQTLKTSVVPKGAAAAARARRAAPADTVADEPDPAGAARAK